MSLRNFPDSNTSINLDFLKSKKLDPRITFERASSGTEIGEGTGVVSDQVFEFQENVPRLTDKGILIEESRTNDCIFSENFTGTKWSNQYTTITANATTAPDGTNTASSLMETADNNEHRLTYDVISSTINCTSIFVKPNGRENIAIRILYGGNGWMTAVYNLTGNGAVTQVTQGSNNAYTELDSDIIPLSNGWYRISLTTQLNVSPPKPQYPILLSTCTSSTPTLDSFLGVEKFTGDTTKGVYIWGAQFELEKGFPTSYIPTSGAATTRAADVCVFNDSNAFGSSSGTFIADATLFAEPGNNFQNQYVFIALAATTADSVSITAGPTYSVQVLDSSIGPGFNYTGLVNYPAYTSGVKVITAAAYAPGPAGSSSADVVYASDGAMRGTNTATDGSTIPTGIYQMYLFRDISGVASSLATGYLHKLAFYPTRLPNSYLEALTS